MPYAQVAIPAPVFHTFTYLIPPSWNAEPGMRVLVHFHRRKMVGCIISVTEELPHHVNISHLKTIETILDREPLLSSSMMQLIEWIAVNYCAPIGMAVRAALPSRNQRAASPGRRTASEDGDWVSEPWRERAGGQHHKLTSAQAAALEKIDTALNGSSPRPLLLHGITGSGKTEIYLRLFEKIVSEGKQAILLVPEIGLTPQLAARVVARFGNAVAIYHSGLTEAQRAREWERMRSGEIGIVVGTRSALFAPLPKLGAIVIDEEHDHSYKQEEGFLYHARETAFKRAQLEKALLLLGSATPSLESFAKVKEGIYDFITLPERATGAQLPMIDIVDMRRKETKLPVHHPFAGSVSLSLSLAEAIETTLAKKEQSLLFLNRRGFANFFLCPDCGYVPECPNCHISLTHHLGKNHLICHYCEYNILPPEMCLTCNAMELLPTGSGTERLEEELRDFFPKARIARLDRDTTSKKGVRNTIYTGMRDNEIDILIGTQIVTKGHDFPNITLVGIIAADSTLHFPDFRAAERAFQLITQVAGRAGRGTKPGRVIVQTYHPHHYSIVAAKDHDHESFFRHEMMERQKLHYPPFSKLVNFRLAGNDHRKVATSATHLADHLRTLFPQTVTLLGPAAAPLEKLRGKYRWQILAKIPLEMNSGELLTKERRSIEAVIPAGIKLTIDVDPVNLL